MEIIYVIYDFNNFYSLRGQQRAHVRSYVLPSARSSNAKGGVRRTIPDFKEPQDYVASELSFLEGVLHTYLYSPLKASDT